MSTLKEDLKRQLIEHLNLQYISPEDITDDQPIFGEGLGLDSIDGLEIIVMLQQEYGVKLTKAEDGPKVLQSVNTIAEYIEANRK